MGRVVSAVITLLAFVLVVSAVRYWVLGIDRTLDLSLQSFAATYPIVDGKVVMPLIEFDRGLFQAHRLATYGHVIFAPLALAIGPLQLWRRLREARPRLHVALGISYMVCVAIGVPCGMHLARFEYGGLTATYGFFGMGVTALLCAAMALYAILGRRNAVAHRHWMIRGYAVLWSSSVLFRIGILLLPHLARAPLPGGFREPYVALVFLSWATGLLGADLYLAWRPSSRPS